MPRKLPPLEGIYQELLAEFGQQHWWPGESPTEVVIGAVLVQNTAWRNVEQAIDNLRQADLLDIERLHLVSVRRLEKLIQPAGYFRVKAKRLRNLLAFLIDEHDASLDSLFALPLELAREQLLAVDGVGP
ncbi:MAG: endonuclease III domain-containing protein, partial [Aeoliella sp.]